MKNALLGIVFAAFVFSSCANAGAKEKRLSEEYNDYVVVSASNDATLKARVKENFLVGYKLVGGVCVANGEFYQAMAK